MVDALFFASVLGLVAALLVLTTVIPTARRAAHAERNVRVVGGEVDVLKADVARLRGEITALESDPWYIERTLKRKMKALRPDLYRAQPLPPTATASVGP